MNKSDRFIGTSNFAPQVKDVDPELLRFVQEDEKERQHERYLQRRRKKLTEHHRDEGFVHAEQDKCTSLTLEVGNEGAKLNVYRDRAAERRLLSQKSDPQTMGATIDSAYEYIQVLGAGYSNEMLEHGLDMEAVKRRKREILLETSQIRSPGSISNVSRKLLDACYVYDDMLSAQSCIENKSTSGSKFQDLILCYDLFHTLPRFKERHSSDGVNSTIVFTQPAHSVLNALKTLRTNSGVMERQESLKVGYTKEEDIFEDVGTDYQMKMDTVL